MGASSSNDGLRSRNWFERDDLDGFLHRSWLKAQGFTDRAFQGRPVIGICNSYSDSSTATPIYVTSPRLCVAGCCKRAASRLSFR